MWRVFLAFTDKSKFLIFKLIKSQVELNGILKSYSAASSTRLTTLVSSCGTLPCSLLSLTAVSESFAPEYTLKVIVRGKM